MEEVMEIVSAVSLPCSEDFGGQSLAVMSTVKAKWLRQMV